MDTKLQKQRPVTFPDVRLISGLEFPLKDYESVALKFVTTQTLKRTYNKLLEDNVPKKHELHCATMKRGSVTKKMESEGSKTVCS